MARRDQTLFRDESDKMIGGVCSGIAQYFDVDTNLVRVAFAVLAAAGGGGVLGYLILWAILDPKPTAPPLQPEAPDIVLDEKPISLPEQPARTAADHVPAPTDTSRQTPTG